MVNHDVQSNGNFNRIENSFPQPAPRIGPRKLISEHEYIRLIEQALYKLGYDAVARELENRSGIQVQPCNATQFQKQILLGNWDDALQLLPKLTSNEDAAKDVRFLVLQQKYLETLEAGDAEAALLCLRTELAPIGIHVGQLHHLAGCLLSPATQDASQRPQRPGPCAQQRQAVIAQVQAALQAPSVMLPEGRLEVLLEQALLAQISRCPFHNEAAESSLSLFSDYEAGPESLPSKCIQVAEAHSDEVWHVAFSHSGTMLATASKDRTIIIWSVRSITAAIQNRWRDGSQGRRHPAACGGDGDRLHDGGGGPLTVKHVLSGHSHAVALAIWSPDDRMLLSVGDEVVRLWEVESGTLLHEYTHHREAATCCAWMPDSRAFLSGSIDRSIVMADTSGREVQRWKRPYRVQDIAVAHNGAFAVVACSDRQIHILRLSDGRETTLHEDVPITSIALSPDSAYLLTALQSHGLHLWHLADLAAAANDVGPGKEDPMDTLVPSDSIAEYNVSEALAGQPGRFVVRAAFGGADMSFIVHGSEDCQVYVWHRDSQELLMHLEGHTATVNACSWNPTNPHMLVSGSDDRTIRVWVSEAVLQQPQGLFAR